MNIFIHRRDLRIQDNKTLEYMQKELGKQKITPIFVFNPKQIYPKENEYFSNNLVEFMCDSLKELYSNYKKRNIEMIFFEGDIIKILDSIKKLSKKEINSVGFNADYSPFSKKRDKKIQKWCEKNEIKFFSKEDMLLVDIFDKKSVNPNSGNPYVVFTPFLRHVSGYDVKKPSKFLPGKGTDNGIKMSNKFIIEIEGFQKYYSKNPEKNVSGGRKNAKKILRVLSKKGSPFDVYNDKRNMLEYKTTMLSAYINLGVISIREFYYSIKKQNSGIITELYWRDFYYNILYFFPDIVGNSFKEKYDKIKWENKPVYFEKWKKGETGFPVVDACMKQLNRTGYMHNRGRMIVSSFLTKDLLTDWRKGEKYFAQNLIDYNISANNGGWQWAAGTGTDAQPFFRIFNPWTQSQKFDPECRYIKKWIPELKNVSPKKIHEWNKYCDEKIYFKPIVQHDVQRKKALDMYKSISK